ncbi:MAG: coenzyme F420-0:L-glutamate ligase [Candidatus Hadarchaeales archaeon]
MELTLLKNFPLVKAGDNLARLIGDAIVRQGIKLEHGDVIVIAQSVVSKAEGRVVDLRKVRPGQLAKTMAKRLGKDPREVQVILEESEEIVRLAHVIISRTRHGFVCANAGVDRSNAGHEKVTLLPLDPDRSAEKIRTALERRFGVRLAVIITDTQGRPFRKGCVGVAVGVAGMKPLLDLRGKKDLYGRRLKATVTCPADAIAAAAVSLMGEAGEGTPVVIVRRAIYRRGRGAARELIRPKERDLFR